MKISFIPQYEITPDKKSVVAELLSKCFEGFPPHRHYFRQLPHFYWVLETANGSTSTTQEISQESEPLPQILGCVSGILRNIRINATVIPMLGILDVCVHPTIRNQGWGSKLLQEVEEFARAHAISILVLFADNPSLYQKNGFRSRKALVRWQMIDEIRQISGNVDERRMDDCFMFKILDPNKKFADDPLAVDLLGWIF
ncbi:MAG: GNAT family N-acetyltransferase [Promethearchaeota archaeon]